MIRPHLLAGCNRLISRAGVLLASITVGAGCGDDVLGPWEPIVTSTALADRPFGAAVSSEGIAFITQLDAATVSRMDLPNTSIAGSVAVGAVPTAVAFHPDGQEAYVTNQLAGNVGVIDPATNAQIGTIAVNGDPFMVAVAPGGSRLAITANSDRVFMADIASRQVIAAVPVGAAPNGIAFHPTESIMYVTSFGSGTVAEISTQSHTVLRTFHVGGVPQGLAISPDGSELYIANEALGLQVWNTTSGNSVTTLDVGGGAFGIALSPDGARLMVTVPAGGSVTAVARTSRSVLGSVDTGGTPRRIAFNGDGTLAVVANEAGWVNTLSN